MNDTCTSSDITFPDAVPLNIENKHYSQFLEKACTTPSLQYAIISFSFQCYDLLYWFRSFKKQSTFHFYWENPAASKTIAAVGSVHRIKSEGEQRFKNVHRSVAELSDRIFHVNITNRKVVNNTHLLGGFSFFDEMKQASSWKGFNPALFNLPEFTLKQDQNETTASVTVALNKDRTPDSLHQRISEKIARLYSSNTINGHHFKEVKSANSGQSSIQDKRTDYTEWTNLILEAKQTIADKKLSKVVLGRQLQLGLQENYNAVTTIHNLRSQYPKCSTFLIKNKDSGTFIGCSPEQLLSVQDNQIRTEALAGSIARGVTEAEDKEWAKQLMNSFKDHEEHTYVVDEIKRSIQPFVRSLESTRQPIIKKLANVQHLYSPIQGIMERSEHALSILAKLHPTPAVGGTPRGHALQYIREQEPFNRGWFASPVGWLTTDGEAEFTVAIRSGLISDKSALLFAGCGIVTDSNPETEWQETNLKFMPMLSALNYD